MAALLLLAAVAEVDEMVVAVGACKVQTVVADALEDAGARGDGLRGIRVIAGTELRVVQLEILGMQQIAGDEAEPVHCVNSVTRGVAWRKFGNHQTVEEFLTVVESLDMAFVGFHHLFPHAVVLCHCTAVAPCVILLFREVEGGVGECSLAF